MSLRHIAFRFWIPLLFILPLTFSSADAWSKPSWKTDGGTDSSPKGGNKGGKKSGGGDSAEEPVAMDISISLQPQSQTVNETDDITLNVSASGSGTLSYQWRKDGTPIPNAIHSYLNLTSVTPLEAGNYDVIITNETGTVSSEIAVIDINPLANIALQWDIPNQREDGTPLLPEEIAEYRIYINYENETTTDIRVPGSLSQVELESMIAGSYEFAIATIDVLGQEGRKSAPITLITN
ncbi:MAG: immunoglobulin domain-containing protein [Oleiphilaceae bacterium]|nr:immunoglobulin domain-containing protein [Oleiphilaceae bacterium]